MTLPTDKYCQNIYDRTIDLINHAQPDLIYFDDTVLPMYPVSEIGLKLAAHFYNTDMQQHGGRNEGVIFGKGLTPEQKQAMVWDIERGQSDKIEPQPWQTDTCLGGWHYDRTIFDQHRYKSSKDVIHMLADIVSKNGNLLLSVPVRADGTIDEDEVRIVKEIGAWLKINGNAIYETRPWKVFGEGPSTENQTAPKGPGFNEGKNKPSGSKDIRFTQKQNAVYAIVLGWPSEPVQIRSLGEKAGLLEGQISSIELLGSDERITWSRQVDALVITPPGHKTSEAAIVFKVLSAR
jgi:alpha-L-fucosidase